MDEAGARNTWLARAGERGLCVVLFAPARGHPVGAFMQLFSFCQSHVLPEVRPNDTVGFAIDAKVLWLGPPISQKGFRIQWQVCEHSARRLQAPRPEVVAL